MEKNTAVQDAQAAFEGSLLIRVLRLEFFKHENHHRKRRMIDRSWYHIISNKENGRLQPVQHASRSVESSVKSTPRVKRGTCSNISTEKL